MFGWLVVSEANQSGQPGGSFSLLVSSVELEAVACDLRDIVASLEKEEGVAG